MTAIETRTIPAPKELKRNNAVRLYAQAALGVLPEHNKVLITEYVEQLKSPQIEQWINEGKLTLGLIRPQVDKNKKGLSDSEAVDEIVKYIESSSLEILTTFSVRFNAACIAEFYPRKIRDRLKELEPQGSKKYDDRLEEFAALMTSGPTTALLLFAEDGKAIDYWRKLIGHWNVEDEETREKGTIRTNLAINNINSLVHGSDGPEAAKRELGVLINVLQNSLNSADKKL